MFREPKPKKHKGERAVPVPVPERGAAVSSLQAGKGGKLGVTRGTLLTQYLMKTQGNLINPAEEKDVRAAMLRHGDAATAQMGVFMSAYQETQPKRIYARDEDDEQDDDGDQAGGGGGGS